MPVLVGFVPTPEGRAAVRQAVRECALRGTRLIVVNSEQGPAGAGGDPAAVDPSADEVRSICSDLGLYEPDLEIRWIRDAYEPADDVLAVAEETAAELIVIGLRRRSGVGKLFLGSSAQRILLDATCPVLAVNVDQRAARQEGAPSSGDVFTLSVNNLGNPDGPGAVTVDPAQGQAQESV
jgi:nucleotide-binding universal stress UspA family protein